MITPPYMNAYQPDRIRLGQKETTTNPLTTKKTAEVCANTLAETQSAARRLVAALIEKHGQERALEILNWGAGVATVGVGDSWIEHLPAETKAYVLAKQAAGSGLTATLPGALHNGLASTQSGSVKVMDDFRVSVISELKPAKPT